MSVKTNAVCKELNDMMLEAETAENLEKLEEASRVLVVVQTEAAKGIPTVTNFIYQLITEGRKLAIQSYVRNVAAEKPEFYETVMRDINLAITSDPAENLSVEVMEKISKPENLYQTILRGTYGCFQALPKTKMIQIANKIGFASECRIAALSDKMGGLALGAVLAIAKVTIDVIINMRDWWREDISGKRCASKILESAGSATGAVCGAYGGAMIGAAAGPAGAVAGAVVGGLVTGKGVNVLMKDMLESIFDIPKTTAEENAYKFFEVHHKASNAELNKAYHAMCLKHHPDKPTGNRNIWDKIQMNFQIIRFARGLDL